MDKNTPKSFGFYWKFYWPLTLMGITLVLGRQFQTGFLARVPNAVYEIAVFAIASSIFGIFVEGFAFVSQMSNVMVKGTADLKIALRFLLIVLLVEFLSLILMAFTGPGNLLMSWCFSLSEEMNQKVCLYILAMIPLLFSQCFYQFYTGLLIQKKKTGAVTTLNIAFLVIFVMLLFVGFYFQCNIILTIIGGQLMARLIQLFFTLYIFRKSEPLPFQSKSDQTYREYWAFFWPVALTSSMFSLSRPILYGFVSRLPESAAIIASLRLAFDANMIFQNMINQFRHLFITYAKEDLQGVVRFMFKATLGITLLMILMEVSGLLSLTMRNLMGVPENISKLTCEVFLLLCFIPAIIGYRNYFHGNFLLRRQTKMMGLGGVIRIILTYLSTWLFYHFGILNHLYAGTALMLGFVAELILNAWSYNSFYKKKS